MSFLAFATGFLILAAGLDGFWHFGIEGLLSIWPPKPGVLTEWLSYWTWYLLTILFYVSLGLGIGWCLRKKPAWTPFLFVAFFFETFHRPYYLVLGLLDRRTPPLVNTLMEHEMALPFLAALSVTLLDVAVPYWLSVVLVQRWRERGRPGQEPPRRLGSS